MLVCRALRTSSRPRAPPHLSVRCSSSGCVGPAAAGIAGTAWRTLANHSATRRASTSSTSTSTSSTSTSTDTAAQRAPVQTLEFYNSVYRAYERVRNTVTRTPLDYSPRLTSMVADQDVKLYLKKEHISITGSYKERGALNKLLLLTPEQREKGVICSSAGNHAQAVSHHSTRLGIDGVIVMPVNTPINKVEATKNFGAQVVQAGNSFAEAYEEACKIAEQSGRTFIHAFNDSDVVAGQGTVALEMLEQNPFLDAVVVPVGGGGLIAGMSVVFKHINPRIKVYGVESMAMPGMQKSMMQGSVVSVPKTATMADGIAIENVGDIPLQLIRECVDDIVLVEEDEMASAVLALLENEKTLVEASGGTALAAILTKKLPLQGKKVGVVLTGGNIDMTLLGRIIDKGLVQRGRMARIKTVVPDVPGSLATVATILSTNRANIKDVEHERAFLMDSVGYTQPVFTVETRDFDHIYELVDKIKAAGFPKCMVQTNTPEELDMFMIGKAADKAIE